MAKIGKPRTSKGLATFCARIAEIKIASDILILDMNEIESAPANFFVVCSCDSDIQVKAVTSEILNKCRDLGINKPRLEGTETYNWVLLDFFDVVVSIMKQDARDYYKLEKLWGDAKFFTLDPEGKLKAFNRSELKTIYKDN